MKNELERGKSQYRHDFRRPFAQYMNARGCPWVTPHVMRRTFASLLASKGASIYKIAKWLGDHVVTTEAAYGHLYAFDSEIEVAAA